MSALKSLTFAPMPERQGRDPRLTRRLKLIEKLEEQRALIKNPNYTLVRRKWQRSDDGTRSMVEVSRRVKPWWRTDSKGTVVLSVIEWAEERIIQRQGGPLDFQKPTILAEQQLLGGLSQDELSSLAGLMATRDYEAGNRMIGSGDPAASLLFVGSGVVSVRLPSGIRLATLSAGMAVGEMALLETHRSADVWADTPVTCLELSLEDFAGFRERHPRAAEHVMANLARLLSKRLIVANNKIEALASY